MDVPTQTVSSDIDFSLLDQPVSANDLKSFKARYPGKTGILSPKKTATIAGGFVFIIATIPALGVFFESNSATPLLIWAILTAGVAAGAHKVATVSNEVIVRMGKFASANNADLIFKTKDPTYNGIIFSEGHSRILEYALRIPGRGEIGEYQYTTGSGKNRSVHRWSYAKIPLDRAMPHMVVDSKQNNFLGISNLSATFDRSQALSLEGDFDQYFTLYTPRQYEQDALYVFTPDVMAVLIDHGANFDIEIVGNELYIYQQGVSVFNKRAQLEVLVDIIERIGGQIKKQTVYYADQKISDRSKNIIAPGGIRLKRGVNYIVVGIFLLFFVNFGLGAVWPRYIFITNTIIGFVFWGFVIYAVIRSVKRR